MISRYSLPRRPWLVRALAVPALLVAALAVVCSGGGDEPVATKSPAPPAAAAAAATAAATVTGTPADSADVVTLTATSGEAELVLEVPAGALPPGVSAADIAVTALDLDQAFAESVDIEPIGAYRFEPDGVQFEVPLRATIELEDGQGAVLARLTSSDGSTEFLSPVTRTIRPSGRTTLVYEIDHFSDFRVYLSVGGSPQQVVFLPPRPRPVYFIDDSFTVRVRIHSGYRTDVLIIREGDRTTREEQHTLRDEPWHAEVVWKAGVPTDLNLPQYFLGGAGWSDEDDLGETPRNEPPLEPQSVTVRVDSPNTFTAAFAEATFTCRRVGEYFVGVLAAVKARGERATSVNGGAASVEEYEQDFVAAWPRTATGDWDRIVGRCVASAPESPTEPPTEPTDGTAGAVGGDSGEEVPGDPESGDSAGDGDPPPQEEPPAGSADVTVSMTPPVSGQTSTVTVTGPANTQFLKVTCHQPTGGEEECTAFVLETDANGRFSGETEMLMGPGKWSEYVCMPAQLCIEEFPTIADLREFLESGDGCQNGACAATAETTEE